MQGLTPARTKGIREAKGELLVFVDDDNFILRISF
jgi:glycosyltransferase involved in cell wall biosynthesis